MIVRLSLSKAVLPAQIVLLTLLSSFAVVSCARADSIQEFVMPSNGYLSIQFIGGEAGGVTTFGLGISPSDFIALLTGLPNSPSSSNPVNTGFFSAGTVIHMGMFTTFAGESGWAFSNGTDQASLVAFSDINNSLGLGGSIIQQTNSHTWVLHLDDALSYNVDDDDNDVLIKLRVTSKPISVVPEPASGLLLLSGAALCAWRARSRRKNPAP